MWSPSMEAAVLRPAGPRQHPMVNALRTVAVASTDRRATMAPYRRHPFLGCLDLACRLLAAASPLHRPRPERGDLSHHGRVGAVPVGTLALFTPPSALGQGTIRARPRQPPTAACLPGSPMISRKPDHTSTAPGRSPEPVCP